MRRHQITDRERRVADFILDKSFGWGRPCVIVPQLKFFTSYTGISVPNIHEALSGLHLKRIIRVVQVKGQMNYCIREDTENWKVSPRVSLHAIAETESLLRELNGLPPLPRTQEELPDFFEQQPSPRTKLGKVLDLIIPHEIPPEKPLPFLP